MNGSVIMLLNLPAGGSILPCDMDKVYCLWRYLLWLFTV